MKELHGYQTSVVTKHVEKNCSTGIVNCVFMCVFMCLSEGTCHIHRGQKTTSRVCPQFLNWLKQSLCSFPLGTPG